MSQTSFRAACGSGEDWESVASACLAGLGSEPVVANVGFIYVTDALAPYIDNLLQTLREETRVERWVGSVGMGICCTGVEIYDQPAAAVMLARLPDDSFRLLPAGIKPLTEALEQNRDWLTRQNVHFGVVHGDPRDPHIPQVIESLSAELDPGFLVGGLSSAAEDMFMQQVSGGVTEGGLSGLLLSGDVEVVSSLTQGCTPMGNRHTITRCDGNIVAELDGRPALDVFREDIGEVLARDLSRVAGYIFAGLPVAGSDTGDYLVRNLVGIDPEEKLLAVGDKLENNLPIMFCRRDGDAAREDMLRMLNDLGNRAGNRIRGGLYFSCLGRGRYQFGENSEELKMIRDQLGDFPLVGFFANGEISHNRLYGYTGVLTLFI